MNKSPFTTPIDNRYLDDYAAGSVHQFGPVEVEKKEIIDFARRFDPQPFHMDPEAAAESGFGGLIASGWHTAGLMMRLFVDHYLSSVASLGSPGVDELRWTSPVRPGDKLWIRVTVVEVRHSRSKPDRGVLRSFVEVLNQDQEVVATMKALNILKRRERLLSA
ncbi:MAG: MaoC family dehydratase [Desulfatiglans sp.]|jgi:acyl dehydratase|nr:MaoC family dehydratase [Thermodesulfobacteriota bacterium]MEE4352292.1 MaoC family dehydratase [Desulfatiglans sp.]